MAGRGGINLLSGPTLQAGGGMERVAQVQHPCSQKYSFTSYNVRCLEVKSLMPTSILIAFCLKAWSRFEVHKKDGFLKCEKMAKLD
ncbi:hypothetical protein CEXT_320871 [Caerostris extrusa]|uniref:Uncharacterized protein n=1 Tax=Caerostris extrusa TaxID=172846 RepID=A0AAV4V6T9_CAEEX|nr:hypothetical protein CEXT_320871 [Caerostris extrusa]